ncbi:response regulator transcription factor [Pectobacterium wasabiae]|uniref:Transcriptional regulator n=1 Tax=Pectobacterium wasabiae TaxID=55208 RepID=A0AAW3EKR0_9GAMM|nr:response regulator transcription factor [Pectobacterium wasabiae]AOR64592.1 helix-turn-helix transcriptional regulator [Pectobacterium wasabiae CFBP 3304]EJS93349.1 Putative HTH-type transcriptional regulator yhjB [Pectobacterium wasabiae CFBP 3304]KFX08915.1 transcriptional regulator [Pectobacterium wasabiae]KGA29022.1 transcriptional regulator [Pectobacterium wasabiae]
MNVLMIDRQSIFIEGMASVLSQFIPDVNVRGLNNKNEIDTTLNEFPATLILLDGDGDKVVSIELLDSLALHHPDIPVVMLMNKCQPTLLRLFLNHRAIAFVSRDSQPETIAQTLRAASLGMFCLPQEGITLLDNGQGAPACLSERQREILKLLAAGESNKQISRRLNISAGTVKAHLESIFRRLNVNNRTQAAMMYSDE